uniref:Elongation factor Ts, mitochondrial n=1 Tax=Choreocolax polysiphoniae TaxID=282351 RepID=A0A0B5W5J9_9FLOR|nr:elongation factor Ts [Choreocolax polysiphoniae]AJH65871.1 elongation factor Ts [Choreocolax polysiphoniae]
MLKKEFIKRIKELRYITKASLINCKKALNTSNYQINIAIEILKKEKLIFANKKLNKLTTEGLIKSYIHNGSKIGVIIELNCETDFVNRQFKFHELAKNITMQIASSKSIKYISENNIPNNIIIYEKKIELKKKDLIHKSFNIKAKITKNRIKKKFKKLSLMNQAFIKKKEITIEELIKEHITLFNENIRIKRFERFILGENLK